jgi:hypothetical protein
MHHIHHIGDQAVKDVQKPKFYNNHPAKKRKDRHGSFGAIACLLTLKKSLEICFTRYTWGYKTELNFHHSWRQHMYKWPHLHMHVLPL